MLSCSLRASALVLSVSFASALVAQVPTAVMADGRVLTQVQPPQIFATEGPIWNLDLVNQGIIVTGRKVTIPATLNGEPFFIAGSSVLGAGGAAPTGIGGANFSRLLDTNAIGQDRDLTREGDFLGPKRLGPARSLFSTGEARRSTDSPDLVRSPIAQQQIEANYFQMVQACHTMHRNVLPADFLHRAGIRGSDPANWVYPTVTGGTLKSFGSVYQDAQGRQYLVPDTEAAIELAENVASGVVRSVARGNATRPDSFVIGDMLVIFSQDPRFGSDVLGLAGTPLSREIFMRQALGRRIQCDTIGHMVGEHVMFVQEVLTEMVDESAPVAITLERIQFRVAGNRSEARWRGLVDKPEDVDQLFAILYSPGANGSELATAIPVVMVPNLEGPGATYNVRLRTVPGINLAAVTHIKMEARAAIGNDPDTGLPLIEVVGESERIDIAPFRQ